MVKKFFSILIVEIFNKKGLKGGFMKKLFLLIVIMTIVPAIAFSQTDIIISQYVDTDSGTEPKGIEIWNNSGTTIDFSTNNLVIEKGTNGGTLSEDFTLDTGTLADGDVIVIGTSDMQTVTENNGADFFEEGFTFNGNDALVVKLGGTTTDVFGDPGSDPGLAWSGNGVSTADQNIKLKSGITTGNTTGFTDPSTRFETVNTSPSGVNGLDGFGIAPNTGTKAEPENHATNITTTVNSFSQITLSWDDATGTPAPDAYLIKVSDTDLTSISDPADTTPESDDTDLSDGSGALNINQGIQSASFSTLEPNTEYFFKIYSYTNSGSDIKYKTDGTIPTANATTAKAPDIVINEILADPAPAPDGDANNDGTRSSDDDEFVEIVNTGTSELDISNWTIGDGPSSIRFTFPASTILQPNQPAVVFGGGTPTGYFGGALVFTTSSLGLANDGDDVIIKDASGVEITRHTYGSEGGENQALTRDTDLTGTFAKHTTLTPGLEFSPGTKNDGTNFGTFINLTGTQHFRLLSIPTSSTSFADLVDPLWTQGMTGADDERAGSPDNVWTWDNNSTTNARTNWQPVDNLTATPAAGTGFLMFVFEDDDGGTAGIQNPFPKSLSLSGSEHTGPVNPDINDNDGGFTLLGNPFASTIDFDDLTRDDLTDVAYVWNPATGTNGEWDTWSNTTQSGNLNNGLIAPFQGFLVQNVDPLTTTPSVTIEEADKSGSANFRGKVIADDPQVLRLELQGQGQGNDINLTNSAWLSFSEQGSANGRVRGDALELASLASDFAQLATSKAGTEKLLDINHLPDAFSEAIELPLSISATQSGPYTLEATDFNIPAGIELIFNDLQTGESLPITEAFSYTLSIEAPEQQQGKQSPKEKLQAPELLAQTASETESAAYSITIEPNVITSVDEEGLGLPEKVELDQNFPNPFNPTTTIRFALPESQQVSLEVYDLLGRRVAQLLRNEVRSAGSHSVNFDAASLSSGVYIYQLRAEGGATITKKLTLIK